MSVFDRFTDRARKVMGYARQASDRFHHDHIGTEHILLGLIEDRTSIAANVLENLDVDLDKLRAEAEKVAGRGDAGNMKQKPFSEHARRVLDCAMEEARGMGHKYVGTEHFLLGLLRVEDREAAKLLRGLGVEAEVVRKEVVKLLSADPVVEEFTVPASEKPSAVRRYLLDYLDERQLKEGREGEEGSEHSPG